MAHISFRESIELYTNIFSATFECTFVPLIFPNSASLSVLQALMETVQSESTIKRALDRSVYKLIKHGYRVKINCPMSVGAEISDMNIKL
jgi:hypothetical protein